MTPYRQKTRTCRINLCFPPASCTIELNETPCSTVFVPQFKISEKPLSYAVACTLKRTSPFKSCLFFATFTDGVFFFKGL